jgi:hypothetical protein
VFRYVYSWSDKNTHEPVGHGSPLICRIYLGALGSISLASRNRWIASDRNEFPAVYLLYAAASRDRLAGSWFSAICNCRPRGALADLHILFFKKSCPASHGTSCVTVAHYCEGEMHDRAEDESYGCGLVRSLRPIWVFCQSVNLVSCSISRCRLLGRRSSRDLAALHFHR